MTKPILILFLSSIDPQGRMGDVVVPPSFGPRRRQGCGNQFRFSPLIWGPPRTHALRSNSTLFPAPKNGRMRQPVLILSPFDWGPLRTQGLCSISTLFWVAKNALVRQPILIVTHMLETPRTHGLHSNSTLFWAP